MTVRAFYRNEIRASILAGVVLAVQTSTAHGPVNLDFIAGALAAYRHTATTFGVSWSRMIGAAGAELGSGYDELLSAAGSRLLAD